MTWFIRERERVSERRRGCGGLVMQRENKCCARIESAEEIDI